MQALPEDDDLSDEEVTVGASSSNAPPGEDHSEAPGARSPAGSGDGAQPPSEGEELAEGQQSPEPLLERRKEPSCPGTLLVSTGSALGSRITMLGGMLAHPCIGVYPYREGPAETIVAAQQAPPVAWERLPRAFHSGLERLGVEQGDLELFFVVTDVSRGAVARARALNVVHHPWCYPSAKPGKTAGSGRHWHVGIHAPPGGGIQTGVAGGRPRGAGPRQRDADPESGAHDSLVPASVHVHPGARGELCCSPNNVRISLPPEAPRPGDLAVFWAACVQDKRERPRACVSLHWLARGAEAAKSMAALAQESPCLGAFLEAAAGQLGKSSAPVRAATAALDSPEL